MLKTYEELRKHPADFIVSYGLYSEAEGGRKIAYQHLRCDFMYEGCDPVKDGLYMIHPQFLDEAGRPIDHEVAVPLVGRASMWIAIPQMRASIHRERIQVGVRGHFMEGARKIGDVRVEVIVGLFENPVT